MRASPPRGTVRVMDKKSVGVGAVALAVAVAGTLTAAASASSNAASAPTAVVESTATRAMDQETYLTIIRGMMATRAEHERTDAELIASGRSICADVDAGATMSTFNDQIREIDGDQVFYHVAIRSSVLAFCPQHRDILD